MLAKKSVYQVIAHVRPLQAFCRPRSGVHDLVQPTGIRGAPRRQARPAIEVTIARCDNIQARGKVRVQFPQLHVTTPLPRTALLVARLPATQLHAH